MFIYQWERKFKKKVEDLRNRNIHTNGNKNLYIACIFVFFIFWACSSARHFLLQSNAYDLGLFDQWIWLVSQNLPPYSSMEGVHILADHGAWGLYLAALIYKINSNIYLLLASQAAGLSLTAIPIWHIGDQAGLSKKLCWLACGLWWLQPVVFNTNLFDFHPEVWIMPALAGCYIANRSNKPWLWFSCLLLLLSCRDGLVLIVAGLGIEQLLRKKWNFGLASIGISLGWLAMLNKWLYPMLTGRTSGPKAAASLFSYLGSSLDEIIVNILTKPYLILQNIDWLGGIIYLLLISIAVAPFWKKNSIFVLSASIPLVIVNLISEESPQRTLIHHYSLPIAVIAVIAAIDGLAIHPHQKLPWKKLAWSAICWAALAKPWFFTGPYLNRVSQIIPVYQAILDVPIESKVLTTSYIVPHLSQRVSISFPKKDLQSINLDKLDVILLNPKDPGWGSNQLIQNKILERAKANNWSCKTLSHGLELCKKP